MTSDLLVQPLAHDLAEELRVRNLRSARLAAFLAAALLPPGIALDWLNDASIVTEFAAVRISAAGACLLVGLLTYTRMFGRHPSVAFILIIALCGGALGYMSHRLAGFASPYYVGIIQVIFAVAVLTYWSWVRTAAACLALALVWLIPALVEGPSQNVAAFANISFAVMICIMIAVVSAGAKHRATIREHMANRALARAARETADALAAARAGRERSEALLGQVTQMRQERLSWLENVARFLQHELKNQIVAVTTSIDLAHSGESLSANRIYLDRARRSLDRMRALVSSTTEATSLDAALAVDQMDLVDCSGVTVDRVTAFQQLHASRHFTLSLRPGLAVEGNEERLAQLLDKLLSNAVEHSPPDAEIRVELRRANDGWIELSVENEGDALPADKERIFEAFLSSHEHADNLGLGLFVARSIACNHGGRITAEDLKDGVGARFLVRLPEAGKEKAVADENRSRPKRVDVPCRNEDQPPQ